MKTMKIITETIFGKAALSLLLVAGLAVNGYAQTPKQTNAVSKKSRTELAEAVTSPVAMEGPRGHDPAMDMYSPKPGGIESGKKVGKAKIVTDPNSKLAQRQNKQLAREERREIRRQNRIKAHKDKLAMGHSVSMKNADPRKVNRVAR